MGLNFLSIRNGVTFGNQTSAPSNPVNGDLYYDSTRNTFVHYNNGGWSDVQSRTDVATAATLTSTNFPTTTVQSSLVRLTGGTASTISGFAAMPDGKQFILYNQSTAAVTLLYNSGTESTAANRIVTPSAGALNINPGYSVTLTYDGSQSRWVVVSTPSVSSGNGTGDDLDSLNFSVSFTDAFADQPSSTLTSVDTTAGKTNASYSSTNQSWAMSYDASKTVTGTSTSMTLSATPSYTVAVGDILRVGTQARRITVVTTQTSYTIESAFTTNPTAAAACVSQAVYTKDLNNFAVDGVAPSAIYTAAINSFLLIYNDTASGTLYNYTDPPLAAYTASADGTNYTSVGIREANPSVEGFTNSAPTTGSNLYFRFFSNASTGSGTVNLVGYKAFFQSQNAVESGGVINQAYAFTNGVGTPYNCSVSSSGQSTTLTLTWSYPMGIQSGAPDGSIMVFLNGQKIPRFINSTLTPDASYTELNGNTIQLDRDYSSQNLNVEVLQLAYVVDSNNQNSTNIATIQGQLNVTTEVDRIFNSGTSQTFLPDYRFYTASCNATAGATYTNNGITFTVYQTVSGSTTLVANGTGAPLTSGTLTKTSGTGDSLITFTAWRLPTALKVKVQGPGGAGGTSAATSGTQASASGGGGGGGYCEKLISGSLLVSSYTYTVGTPGTASTFSGGSVSMSAASGSGGAAGAAETGGPVFPSGGAVGGSASGGDINCTGGFGMPSMLFSTGQYLAGMGGGSVLGGFAINVNQGGTGPGTAGQAPGIGGSGATAGPSNGAQSGGAGANGQIIIEQHYIGG